MDVLPMVIDQDNQCSETFAENCCSSTVKKTKQKLNKNKGAAQNSAHRKGLPV